VRESEEFLVGGIGSRVPRRAAHGGGSGRIPERRGSRGDGIDWERPIEGELTCSGESKAMTKLTGESHAIAASMRVTSRLLRQGIHCHPIPKGLCEPMQLMR
jgi:hypothetical protein